MTCFVTCITDKESVVIKFCTSYTFCWDMYTRWKHDSLPALLSQNAHYVNCCHFVLHVSIFCVNFADTKICFLFFPFQLQNSLSADVLLGGNFVLINKSVLLFSLWEMTHVFVILRPACNFEIRGGTDNSLTQHTSRRRRTKSIVLLERYVCSCAELQVFSC